MSASTHEFSFELVLRGEDTWRGYWAEEKVGVEVGGTAAAPTGSLLATLRDAIVRWAELGQTIAAFVRGLAPDHHVPLDPPSHGGFAARSCGFDQELVFQSISVTASDAPHRVDVTFYTGYPDGYATFAIVLDGGVPTEIRAFAS